MELLIVLILIALILVSKDVKKINIETITTNVEPKCPPHKWRYEDIKDHEGNIRATQIVCEYCGPIKAISAPEKTDY